MTHLRYLRFEVPATCVGVIWLRNMGRLGLVGPLGLVILAPLGTSLGLVGGVTFARRGREIALRSLTCEENLIYFSTDFTCLLVNR